ncbi:MAG: hypothetical protein AB8I08_15550 [Sandaracinaceae bacterium]
MWSDRTPLETVAAVQTASCPVTDDAYTSFVAAVTARAKPPFSGPDPACSVPRFGTRPDAVLLRREKDRLVVRGTEREPDVANATLHTFLDAVGTDAAADAGLTLEVSPAEYPIPVGQRRRWMVLPHAGELEPRYRAHVTVDGTPKVIDEGWATPPTPLPCMDGHEVRMRVWDPPEPDAAELIGAAIANLRRAGPELLAAATEPIYQYYLYIAGSVSDEAFECGIPRIERPADVWKHVQLGRYPGVSASLDDAGGYLHAGVAYVTFECECDWEREHGLALVFIDGNRLGRVSSYDGHPTWAHAYADPSMLDLVYRPRG